MFRIAPDVFQIPLMPRQSINAYLLGDVVVDAGIRASARKLMAAIDGRALSAHVLTHAHPDHQGASHALCTARNLPLWCHAAERRAAESGNVTSNYPHPDSLLAKMQQRLLAGPGHPVARTLAEGDEVAGFRVVECPGHTRGQIALWREGDGLLVAGDAAVGMNLVTTARGLGLPLKTATVDMAQARASLRCLAALGPRKVAFGHGPVAEGDAFRRFVDGLPD